MKNIWLKADVLGVYQPFLSASNVLKLYNFETVDIKVIGFRILILVKNELKRDIIWRKMLTSYAFSLSGLTLIVQSCIIYRLTGINIILLNFGN